MPRSYTWICVSTSCAASWVLRTHHVSSLGACDRKLEVGILLPIAEEKREFREKAIVDISNSGDSLGAGIAVDATFKRFASAHELLPRFIAIRVFVLLSYQPLYALDVSIVGMSYHFDEQLSQLDAVLTAATKGVHLDAGKRSLLVSIFCAPL